MLQKTASKRHLDFVVSQIQAQQVLLNNVVETIERINDYNDEYIHESLRKVQVDVQRLRRFIDD